MTFNRDAKHASLYIHTTKASKPKAVKYILLHYCHMTSILSWMAQWVEPA